MASAKGAKLQIKNTTYQDVKYLGDFNFPLPEAEIVDATNHDSTGDQEEMIPTIKKAAKISVPITKWDESDTVHQFLITSNATVQSFKYTGTGYATAFAFNAILKLTLNNPVKGIKSATLELTISDGATPA